MKNSEGRNRKKLGRRVQHLAYFTLGFFFVVAVLIVSAKTTIGFLGAPDSPGTFGDMFGAPNALFSALALLGLVYAILLQKEDLKITSESLRQQSFENTFFQLLEYHLKIVKIIETQTSGSEEEGATIFGQNGFYKFQQNLFSAIKNATGDSEDPSPDPDLLGTAYSEFYKEYQVDLGRYFRSLSYILNAIHNSVAHEDQKRAYTNLVISQITPPELTLIFYNCLSDPGKGNFCEILEEYAMLKYLTPDLLVCHNHFKIFKKGAYGDEYPEIFQRT